VAIKTFEKEIGGITYKTKTFPARQALKLAARLARMVVADTWKAALALDLEGEDAGISGVVLDPVAILDGLVSAAKAVPPDEIADLAVDILAETTASDVAGSGAAGPVATHFDSHFAGRLPHLFEVVFWVARMGFGVP
jgi:hypothetical protein